jgi:predicted permease
MSFDPQLVRYTAPQTAHFYDELIRRVRMLPGVRNAALTGSLPMAGGENSLSVIPEGYQMPKGKDDFPIQMATAGDRYFQTFGVELMQGRAFNDTDTATSTKVAVVNQEFAHHYWPNASALGKRFRIDSANRPLIQIVGIAKTGKYDWIGEAPTEFVYLPFAQHSRTAMTLLVQTEGPSQASISAVRGLAQNLDPNQPIFDVLTIEDYYHRRVVMAPVMVTQAVSAMGIIGLILAMAGLYGLIAQAASRRTREIGIRMAIGATSANVLRMVLRQAVLLVAIGLCIGLIFAFAVEKGLNAVFQVSGIDIGAYLLILPALVFVTMLAAFIPARKASRIEPTRALRYE